MVATGELRRIHILHTYLYLQFGSITLEKIGVMCKRDTPAYVHYMAMKRLRMRITEGIYNTFKCIQHVN